MPEFYYDCSVHGRQADTICCVTISFVDEKGNPVPEEKIREHVKCAHEGCKSVFWRPQEAEGALSTMDLAQLRGWTVVDREKGLVHCAWGHKD